MIQLLASSNGHLHREKSMRRFPCRRITILYVQTSLTTRANCHQEFRISFLPRFAKSWVSIKNAVEIVTLVAVNSEVMQYRASNRDAFDNVNQRPAEKSWR